jgi:hypothetical protein
MIAVVWIRRDRATGEETEVDSSQVYQRLKGFYYDLYTAMKAAKKKMPVSTLQADYWPKGSE